MSLELIPEIFKLPITYDNNVRTLDTNIINSLELVKLIEEKQDIDTTLIHKPIYEYIFKPSNVLGNIILKEVPKYYTTNIKYLKDTQQLLSLYAKPIDLPTYSDCNIDEYVNIWKELQLQTGFCEKYLFVDWEFAKTLNNNPLFLQLMSSYNIVSPILSLLLPIFILIVPFLILKISNMPINITTYIDILKNLASHHAIGKIFTEFQDVSINQKLYLILSAGFYVFSIYQNVLICCRFYSNMKTIHDYIYKFKNYLNYTIDNMTLYLSKSNNLSSYTLFNNNVHMHLQHLQKLNNDIYKITPLSFSIDKFFQIGHIMYTFYQLYDNKQYNESLLYSFGFNGYVNIIQGMSSNIVNSQLNKAQFVSSNKHIKPKFKNTYYPKFIDNNSCSKNNIVKNSFNLDKNIIITGPNASGKTTILKTAIINLLVSQQFGMGCFERLKFKPFDNFHCYLNIPDTSGRDSLFEAEARRCKNIINSINASSLENYFCIFDELYSGTNPKEAELSASAFMNYIVKCKNVTCLLTTHYVKICNNLKNNINIKNCKMNTIKQDGNLINKYKLISGISNILGGCNILKNMNYPQEIIMSTAGA